MRVGVTRQNSSIARSDRFPELTISALLLLAVLLPEREREDIHRRPKHYPLELLYFLFRDRKLLLVILPALVRLDEVDLPRLDLPLPVVVEIEEKFVENELAFVIAFRVLGLSLYFVARLGLCGLVINDIHSIAALEFELIHRAAQ